MRFRIFVFVGILALVPTQSVVWGATTVSLSPARLETAVDSGQTLLETIVISNQSDRTLEFSTSVQDLKPSSDPREAYLLVPSGEVSARGIVDKIYLSDSIKKFNLSPGQSRRIPLELRVPGNVQSGTYSGTVLFSVQDSAGANQARAISQLGSLIFLKVNGPALQSGQLLEFALAPREEWGEGETNFQLLFQNSGETHLNPYGRITVSNWRGRPLYQQVIEPWFTLPGSTRLYEVSTPRVPNFYSWAKLELNRGYDNQIDSQTIILWPGGRPIFSLLLAVLILGGLFSLFYRRRKRARVIFGLLFFLLPVVVGAEVASSTNYQIAADSISIAGGVSSSTNYQVNQTVGEIATGTSTSANYNIKAGYQSMLGGTLTVTTPSDITLSSINTSGQSNGSGTWQITSDTGYSFKVKAGSSPALTASGPRGIQVSLSDYAGAPDYDWFVDTDEAGFGFSPEGNDLVTAFKNNGSICGSGSGTTEHCWDGFSTSDQTIAQTTSAVTNRSLTLKIRSEIGSAVLAGDTGSPTTLNGAATLTITITAL